MLKSSHRRVALEDAFTAAISALRETRTPYMVIGAFALSAWGRPRATLDVDFMILADNVSEKLSATLSKAGFRIDEKWSPYNPMIRSIQQRLRLDVMSVPVDTHRFCIRTPNAGLPRELPCSDRWGTDIRRVGRRSEVSNDQACRFGESQFGRDRRRSEWNPETWNGNPTVILRATELRQ